MTRKTLWIGMTVMALVFGLTLAGCTGGSGKALNGSWEDEYGTVITLKNGKFELPYYDGSLFLKGTYTTDDNKFIPKMTHLHGAEQDLEDRWYTRAEIKEMWDMIDKEIDEDVDTEVPSGIYVISGNKLFMLSEEYGYFDTFTRVQPGK